jgi:RNA polymerase sigma-70 factor (ECF subfamily)
MRGEESLRVATWEDDFLLEGHESIQDRLCALMDRYEQPVYRFLFAMIGDVDIVQDCTQDTFVRAYENLRKGKPVNAAWLYKVARNCAIDELRHRRRQQPDAEQLDRTPIGGGIEGVAIGDAFAQLPPDDRTLLYLVGIEGRSPNEIAEILGIKPTAARTRISRARQRLRLAYGSRP